MNPLVIKIFVAVTAPPLVSELFMQTSEANPKFSFWGVGWQHLSAYFGLKIARWQNKSPLFVPGFLEMPTTSPEGYCGHMLSHISHSHRNAYIQKKLTFIT